MRDDPIGLVLAIYRVVPVLIESGAEDLARDLFAFYSDRDPGRAGPVGAALWGAVEGLIASTRDFNRQRGSCAALRRWGLAPRAQRARSRRSVQRVARL